MEQVRESEFNALLALMLAKGIFTEGEYRQECRKQSELLRERESAALESTNKLLAHFGLGPRFS